MRFIALLALLGFVFLPAQGATLRLGAPEISENQYRFPVYLQGGADDVAALDFRLAYDPAVFVPVSAHSGPSAASAQKQVSSNVAVPGEFVVVMMGFNQNSVAPGEVVQIVLEKIHEPETGESILRIAEPTMATVDGAEIDSRGLARTIQFGKPKEQENTDGETDDTGDLSEADSPGTTPDGDAVTKPGPANRFRGGVPFVVAGRGGDLERGLLPDAAPTGGSPGSVSTVKNPSGTRGAAPLAAGNPPQLPEDALPALAGRRPDSGGPSARPGEITAPAIKNAEAPNRVQQGAAGRDSAVVGAGESAAPGRPARNYMVLVLILGLAPLAGFVVYKVLVR